mmetsp:Transcript_161159/g.512315  ORF Transcript_161159/g.512315 Transcript_161159/m.512315 type:complete len:126 (-) Transcript_161159:30-407(-)
MKPELADTLVGPESIQDACDRVIAYERDLILTYNLLAASSRARGPIIFVPLGAGHVKRVKDLLKRPPAWLDEEVKPFLVAPQVPAWKALSMPVHRIMRFFQLVAAVPKIRPSRTSSRKPFYIAVL